MCSDHVTHVIFELDVKCTVDAFHSNRLDLSEFGLIIQDCHFFFFFFASGITVLNLFYYETS